MDSWTNLCRCCLSPDYDVSLLDTSQNVKEKFFSVTSIEVKVDDGLPQMLCSECHATMNSAFQFRTQCIKMDNELKIQLNAILEQAIENSEVIPIAESEISKQFQNFKIENVNQLGKDKVKEQFDDDIATDPMKQLEAIIKTEQIDSGDDDYYYVLVVDDKEKECDGENKYDDLVPKIKLEPFEVPINEKEGSENENNFETSIDSFLVSNPKIPANVPATILENEDESQDNDDFEGAMDIDESQDNLQNNDSQDKSVTGSDIVENIANIKGLPNSQNIIKILATTEADGTLVLKGEDGIQYLTDAELVTNDGDDQSQEEIIFCEGDEDSQFQILKTDGSELVIMQYADDSQIATVMQQEDGTFVCECGESFVDLNEYEKHQYQHNSASENFCNLCGKGFESPEILAGHVLLHNVSGPSVACPFCDQYIKRNALTQHIKYGHSNLKPRCSVCLKTFANTNNLKRHELIHKGIKEFECDICFKRFHQKITMQTHRLKHLNSFVCNECDETFENTNDLKTHKKSDKCTKSKILKVKKELMKTVKKEIKTNLGKLIGYACSLCKRMFSVESVLENHIETTHMVDPSKLLCSECGEVLPSQNDMQTHILTHKNFKGKNIKRFNCSSCGKGCTSQAMLVMHERVHTNERPFPCQLCSLRFKTKTHLRTHQLTHTREKKFGCSICMKFFALKGNLVVHLRTHTGERPYVCSLCDEAFIDSKYLKKHKLKKHAIDNVPWNQY